MMPEDRSRNQKQKKPCNGNNRRCGNGILVELSEKCTQIGADSSHPHQEGYEVVSIEKKQLRLFLIREMITVKKEEKSKISNEKYCCREPKSLFPVVYHGSNSGVTRRAIQKGFSIKDQCIIDLLFFPPLSA
jgi:hypothetical protein